MFAAMDTDGYSSNAFGGSTVRASRIPFRHNGKGRRAAQQVRSVVSSHDDTKGWVDRMYNRNQSCLMELDYKKESNPRLLGIQPSSISSI